MRQVNQCLDLICRSGRHHGVTRKAGNTTLAFFAKPAKPNDGSPISGRREDFSRPRVIATSRAPTLFSARGSAIARAVYAALRPEARYTASFSAILVHPSRWP